MAGQVRDTTEICPLVTQFVDSDETLTGLSSFIFLRSNLFATHLVLSSFISY